MFIVCMGVAWAPCCQDYHTWHSMAIFAIIQTSFLLNDFNRLTPDRAPYISFLCGMLPLDDRPRVLERPEFGKQVGRLWRLTMAAQTKKRPVHELRIGRIRAAIWRNEGSNGPWHSVSFERM